MTFTPIDMETWHRKPYFLHYHKDIPCTYSITVSLDITVLKKTGVSLYPALLYLLTKNLNHYEQFRTAFDEKGNVASTPTWSHATPFSIRNRKPFPTSGRSTARIFPHSLRDTKPIWKPTGTYWIWTQNQIHRPTPSPFPWCHGPRSQASICTCKRVTTISCPYSHWARHGNTTGTGKCPLPYRYIMVSAMDSM